MISLSIGAACAEAFVTVGSLHIALVVAIFGVARGYAQVTAFAESFDGVTAPEAPSGWTLGAGWETSSVSASSGSALNNLKHAGSSASDAVTSPFDLNEATFATLSFLARRTSSYDVENLRVTASTDGGLSFSSTVLASGTALPSSASTYASISIPLPTSLLGRSGVILRFEGSGGSGASSNIRIDDVLVTSYSSGDLSGGTLGFGASSGAAGQDTVAVPIRADFVAPPGLQGLQFTVRWPPDSLSFVDASAGAALSDDATWTLAYEAAADSARIVLIADGVSSLPSGAYDSLLTLRFAPEAFAAEELGPVSLSNVVSALATPEGSDAGIQLSAASYTLTIAPGVPAFHVSASALDVGLVEVGQVDSVVATVSNPGGPTSLLVASVTTTNPLFTVAPTGGVVAPDDSLQFVLRFAPVDTAFGLQTADVRFDHNGADGVTFITITGKGRGGRGDAEGDGTVDVLDVIYAIDIVLARFSPGPAQTAAADLFPFPDGDDELDVRDLTVLSQAVARGRWPDDLLLPTEAAAPAKSSAGAVELALLRRGSTGYVLELRHDVAIRGFQLIFPSSSDAVGVAAAGRPGLTLLSGYDAVRKELRVVAFVADGGEMEAGVARLEVSAPVESPRYATVVDANRDRIAVDARIPTLVETEEAQRLPVGPPYPNPFRVKDGPLRIDGIPAGSNLNVFDLLGRRVLDADVRSAAYEWDGRDATGAHVPPGLYLVRLRGESGPPRTWAVVVVP